MMIASLLAFFTAIEIGSWGRATMLKVHVPHDPPVAPQLPAHHLVRILAAAETRAQRGPGELRIP